MVGVNEAEIIWKVNALIWGGLMDEAVRRVVTTNHEKSAAVIVPQARVLIGKDQNRAVQ